MSSQILPPIQLHSCYTLSLESKNARQAKQNITQQTKSRRNVHTQHNTHTLRKLWKSKPGTLGAFYKATIVPIMKLERIKIPRKKEGAKMKHCLCGFKNEYEKSFLKISLKLTFERHKFQFRTLIKGMLSFSIWTVRKCQFSFLCISYINDFLMIISYMNVYFRIISYMNDYFKIIS